MSRKSYPKQFVNLTGDESLYQASARRLFGAGFTPPTIVTAADFRFIVIEQLAALEIVAADILIEPSAKNTAAAICAAALALEARAPGALMLVAPSDHVIPEATRFRDAVQAAAPAALAGQLVTFGIRPDRPETGYGWLELSTPTPDFAPLPQPLRSFVEKPDLSKAEVLLAGSMHLWVYPNKGTKRDIGRLAVHDSHPMLLEKGVRWQSGVQKLVFLVFGACTRPCPQRNVSGQL